MDFLSAQVWQGISGILAIISTLLAIRSNRLQRSRRSFSWELVTNTPLFRVQEEAKDQIKVYLNEKPVERVSIIMVKLCNTGDQAIMPSDFVSPIKFVFGAKSEILDVQVMETNPSSLMVLLKKAEREVEIEPILLNSKDSILLKFIVNDMSRVDLVARIVNIPSIERVNVNHGNNARPLLTSLPTLWKSMVITSFIVSLLIMAFVISLISFWLNSGYSQLTLPH